jgi:ATP-dependent protease Clp ATPase subunit
VGQEKAIKTMAVGIYNHGLRIKPLLKALHPINSKEAIEV